MIHLGGIAHLELATAGRVVVAGVSGEVDLSNTTPLRDAIEAAVVPETIGVVLDLRELEHLDSSGVHLLTLLHHNLERHGRGLRIVRPRHRVPLTVFTVIGIDGHLPVCGTREEAVASLERPRP